MNEIEKAIQEIEDMAYLPSLKKEISAASMCVILRTLQEKTNREKGCEHCSNHKPLVSPYTEYSIEFDGKEISV